MADLTEKEAKSHSESQKLSTTGIQHIASLARIKLSEDEKKRFQKDLGSILDYVNKLKEVDTEHVQPVFQTTGIVNATREDQDRGEFKMNEGLDEKLIGQAPEKEGRFVKVKSILTRGNK